VGSLPASRAIGGGRRDTCAHDCACRKRWATRPQHLTAADSRHDTAWLGTDIAHTGITDFSVTNIRASNVISTGSARGRQYHRCERRHGSGGRT